MSAIEAFQPQTLDALMRQADMLSKSSLVPKAFRGKPADILVATMWGSEMGLGPIASLNYIDVIEGSPSMSAEGRISLIRSHGHSVTWTLSDDACVVKGKRRDTGDEGEASFTMKDAQTANLAQKQVWKQYRQDMLFNRAVSRLSRRLFSDVMMGLSYAPEEVASFAAPRLMDQPEALVRAGRGRPIGDDGQGAPSPTQSRPAQLPVATAPATVEPAGGDLVGPWSPPAAPVEVTSASPRSFAPPASAKTTKPAETMREAQAAVAAVNEANAGKVVGDGVGADAMKALRSDLAALTVQTLRDELRDQFAAAGLPNIKAEGIVLDDDEYAVALDLVLKKLEKQAELEQPFEEPSLLEEGAGS